MSIFGAEFEKIWPAAGSSLNFSDYGKTLLKKCLDVKKPETINVDIHEFKRKSSNFPLEFGTNTCRVISQPKDRYPYIERQIASAYPIIHERVLKLYLDFLEHKSNYGSISEQKLYRDLQLTDFVQRLLTKRCVTFMGPKDLYLLLTGDKGQGDEYLKIGTQDEIPPLVLNNVISYDEIKLSAFLTVTSHTDFINDGNRNNRGVIETDLSKIERSGVVVGLIGARFERFGVMEYQDVIIDPRQNVKANGYGAGNAKEQNSSRLVNYRHIWNGFYENSDYLYEQSAKDEKRFGETFSRSSTTESSIFDNVMMKKRYSLTFDTLLVESEARARQLSKQAYIHVVGIGLGVWKVADQQTKIFLETFTQRLKYLLPQLNHIGVVHFSWFHLSEWGDLRDNGTFLSETHPQGGIKTYLSKRNPNEKLTGNEAENMLLIVSYAWDGNALPGNEFWLASLDGSNDPSTACSTLVSELHNPHINDAFVSGRNLHVATLDNGVLHISDYVEKIKDKLWKACNHF
ncbi:uncharacterized protein LOC119643517 isoform X1 [Glossina fuscipes]|uniref:Uncharacterized protein LOC119643517 isoform X1 n=1 Tax=Glossina fuscipes TaxID=7396 RepID=A0A9C5ZM92_9MUSC|nr:uncharacterized protein LOC119643517 isoform X1 [Glossina fuscipes]